MRSVEETIFEQDKDMDDEIPPIDFLALAHRAGIIGDGYLFDLIAPLTDLSCHLWAELEASALQVNALQEAGPENLVARWLVGDASLIEKIGK